VKNKKKFLYLISFKLIGKLLQQILPDQKELVLLILVVASLAGTELMSNASMASIFIPIANSLVICILNRFKIILFFNYLKKKRQKIIK
jgi:di/tricarboxylate transporter